MFQKTSVSINRAVMNSNFIIFFLFRFSVAERHLRGAMQTSVQTFGPIECNLWTERCLGPSFLVHMVYRKLAVCWQHNDLGMAGLLIPHKWMHCSNVYWNIVQHMVLATIHSQLRPRGICLDDITTRWKQKTVVWTLLVNESAVPFDYNMPLPEKKRVFFCW
jgi:hypothetical protein